MASKISRGYNTPSSIHHYEALNEEACSIIPDLGFLSQFFFFENAFPFPQNKLPVIVSPAHSNASLFLIQAQEAQFVNSPSKSSLSYLFSCLVSPVFCVLMCALSLKPTKTLENSLIQILQFNCVFYS